MKTFKELVEDRGLTHGQLAMRTGLSRSYITQMVNKTKTPSEAALKLLVNELGCKLVAQRVPLSAEIRLAVKIEDGEVKEQYYV